MMEHQLQNPTQKMERHPLRNDRKARFGMKFG